MAAATYEAIIIVVSSGQVPDPCGRPTRACGRRGAAVRVRSRYAMPLPIQSQHDAASDSPTPIIAVESLAQSPNHTVDSPAKMLVITATRRAARRPDIGGGCATTAAIAMTRPIRYGGHRSGT